MRHKSNPTGVKAESVVAQSGDVPIVPVGVDMPGTQCFTSPAIGISFWMLVSDTRAMGCFLDFVRYGPNVTQITEYVT